MFWIRDIILLVETQIFGIKTWANVYNNQMHDWRVCINEEYKTYSKSVQGIKLFIENLSWTGIDPDAQDKAISKTKEEISGFVDPSF